MPEEKNQRNMADAVQEERSKNHIVRTVKAVILAGGKGTRAKPYSEFFPKAMIPIEGRPLIDYIVRYLSKFSFIDEIVIISDFSGLGGQIRNYFESHRSNKKISFIQDTQSGTGGDLLHIERKVGKSDFVLWFVDNLCAIDIEKMYKFFRESKSIACIATRNKRKEETGFAIIEKGIVKKFVEKPVLDLAMPECLGIYILGKEIIKEIKKKSKKNGINLSYDILVNLATRDIVSAFDIGKSEWIDAESPIVLERNEKTVKKILRQMGF